jgi:hypothetical protein
VVVVPLVSKESIVMRNSIEQYINEVAHEGIVVRKIHTDLGKELGMVKEKDVWEVVERKQGVQLLRTLWVFNVKADGRHKGRLVVDGSHKSVSRSRRSPSRSPTRTPFAVAISWT